MEELIKSFRKAITAQRETNEAMVEFAENIVKTYKEISLQTKEQIEKVKQEQSDSSFLDNMDTHIIEWHEDQQLFGCHLCKGKFGKASLFGGYMCSGRKY